MSHALEVVQAQVDAYRVRDLERLLSHFADDASVIASDGSPMYAGTQAL
jgi:hypothetical protein